MQRVFLLSSAIFLIVLSGCTSSVMKTGRSLDAAQSVVASGDVNMKNSDGDTALHYAAGEGNLEITTYLLDHGAKLEAVNKWGNTPFLAAVIGKNMTTVRYLLDHGADVKVKNQWGITPLHSAASSGELEIVKLLVANGADTDAKSSDGDTPLIWASRVGHPKIVKYLLGRGADKSIQNKKKQGAYSVAIEAKREDIMMMLQTGEKINNDGASLAFAQAQREDTISAYEHFQAFYPNNPLYTKQAAVLAQAKRDSLKKSPKKTKQKLEKIREFLDKEDLPGLLDYVNTLQ